MGYATLSHVLELVPHRTFSATSKPQASQVQLLCDQVAAELDVALRGNNYTVPVATGATVAYGWLQYANAVGAAYHVELAAQASDRRDDLRVLWQDLLERLRDDTVDLSDASQDTRTAFPLAPAGSAWFTRGMEF